MHEHSFASMTLELFTIDTYLIDATLEIIDGVLILLNLLAQLRFLGTQGEDILQTVLPSKTHIQDESEAKDAKPVTQYKTACFLYLIHLSNNFMLHIYAFSVRM